MPPSNSNQFNSNTVPALFAVSNADGQTPVYLWADPSTHGLIVEATATLAAESIPATSLTEAVAVQIVDGSGNQITSFGGGTQYNTNVAYQDGDTGTLAITVRDDVLTTLTEADGDFSTLRVDANGGLWVSLATALNSTDDTVGADGTVSHDSADSNNPVKIGAKAETALSGVTLVADGDRTDLYAGVDGVLITRPHANLEDIVSGNASNTDGTSTSVIAAAGAGIKQYLTSFTITNTSATDTFCEIKSGTTVKWTVPVPANGGITHSFAAPLPPNAANEAWNFDMGAAVTTAYASFVGFKSKV